MVNMKSVDTEQAVDKKEAIIKPVVPTPCDFEWTDYVLKELHPDELVNGNPTVDALRRLAEKYIGLIVGNYTALKQSPTKEDPRVIVLVSIQFKLKDVHIDVDGLADASPTNTPAPFNKYMVATAETRAEGRALRKALKLRKVVTAEEVGEGSSEQNPPQLSSDCSVITNNQLNFIEIMCRDDKRGMDINVEKFVKTHILKIEGEKTFDNIYKLKHEQAVELLTILNKYQQDIESIPTNIKGYDNGWRTNFAK